MISDDVKQESAVADNGMAWTCDCGAHGTGRLSVPAVHAAPTGEIHIKGVMNGPERHAAGSTIYNAKPIDTGLPARMKEEAKDLKGKAERTFTRAEVLKWLKDRRQFLEAAGTPAAYATVCALVSEFERME